MTKEECGSLVKDLSVDMIRRNESFTIVYGHEAHSRLSCHIYYDHTIDKICIFKYKFIEDNDCRSVQMLDTVKSNHVFFKRLYPEACDYESVVSMLAAGWNLCFSPWKSRETTTYTHHDTHRHE
jgi:hypothetical protein